MSPLRFVRLGLSLAILAGCAMASGRAQAQGWLEDRNRAEGPGFRIGDLELHPGVGAEVGYDTNVFLSSDREGVDDRQTSPMLRVTPHLFLSTLGPQRTESAGGGAPPVLDFRTGVSGSFYHYFDTNAQDNLELDASAQATLLPSRPVGFSLLANYGRSIRPFTEEGAINNDYARNQIGAGGKLLLQTRGGVWRGSAGYTFGADVFEGDSFQFANSVSHKASVDSAWRFLPSTALLYDGEVTWQNFTSDEVGNVLLADQARIRTRFGFNGFITNVVSVLGMVGYGVGFYDAGDDYDSVVGQAQLGFAFSRAVNLTLGYDRDFFRAFVGNFYLRDRGSLRLQLMFGGALLTAFEAGVAYYDFGQTFDVTATGSVGDTFDRGDVRADGSLFVEYRFTDWFAANARVEYTGNFTDYEFNRTTSGAPNFDPASFNRWVMWGGVRVFY